LRWRGSTSVVATAALCIVVSSIPSHAASTSHAAWSAFAAAITRTVGDCSNPCTIQSNNGGIIVDFEHAGDAIRGGARQKLVIDGFCASACMVMADRARPRACITSRTVFAYHKTNYNRPIPLSGGLRGWIMRHGGFPSFNGTPGIMPNEVARQFWPLCSGSQTVAGISH
jgi:hypothetical protein